MPRNEIRSTTMGAAVNDAMRVEIVVSDRPDTDAAQETISLKVVLAGRSTTEALEVLQLAALRRAQNAIVEAIRALPSALTE